MVEKGLNVTISLTVNLQLPFSCFCDINNRCCVAVKINENGGRNSQVVCKLKEEMHLMLPVTYTNKQM